MKSFLKQINESFQALDEKDWDGDGEQESPEDEYRGVKDRAIQKAMNDAPECDSCYGGGCEDCKNTGMKPEYQNEAELDEISTSVGSGAYNTPKSFAPTTNNRNATQSTGMGVAPKTKLHTEYDYVQEAMDRKYEQLIEGYKNFALGKPNSNPKQTVNSAIREVAKKLKEIEETVKWTGRLKTESGISHSGFSSGTHNALRKISERLIKISERVRSLGE